MPGIIYIAEPGDGGAEGIRDRAIDAMLALDKEALRKRIREMCDFIEDLQHQVWELQDDIIDKPGAH